jgi:hypothetical protein
MKRVTAFLGLFILGVCSDLVAQDVWQAEFVIQPAFPEGLSAPIRVQVIEPFNAKLAIQEGWYGTRYVVSSPNRYSHVLFRVDSYDSWTESINSGELSWSGTKAYAEIPVKFKVAVSPSIQSINFVSDQQSQRGLEITVSNPYDRELLVTKLRVCGSNKVQGNQQLTSFVYHIEAAVRGQLIRGKAKESISAINREVEGAWVDGGTIIRAGLDFNPNAGIPARQNGQFDLFATIKRSSLVENGIGTGRPPIAPSMGSMFDALSDWEVEVTVDNELEITRRK